MTCVTNALPNWQSRALIKRSCLLLGISPGECQGLTARTSSKIITPYLYVSAVNKNMGFSDFHGNSEVVHRMRDMLARMRLPHAVILAGPHGSGKYILALMLDKVMMCLSPIIKYRHLDFLSQ